MALEGTCRLTRLQLAQLSLDFTKSTPEIKMLTALLDPVTGATAFMRSNGSVWSAETQDALRKLIESLERDVARLAFSDTEYVPSGQAPAQGTQVGGLSEHLNGTDVPDM